MPYPYTPTYERVGRAQQLALVLAEVPRTGEYLIDIKKLLLRFFRTVMEVQPSGKLLWLPRSDKMSEVELHDEGPLNATAVEKTPAIVLQRGVFTWANTSKDQLLRLDDIDGLQTFTDLFVGSFSIHCISRESLYAERMAVSIFRLLTIFRDILQQCGLFKLGPDGVSIGKAGPVGDLVLDAPKGKFISVPVFIPVYYQDTWTMEYLPAKPTLAALRYTTQVRGRILDQVIFTDTEQH